MEADLPPQYSPVPRIFGSTFTPLHGIRMDAEWKRTRLRLEKPKDESIAIGAPVRKCSGFDLMRVQSLDVGRGLSFLHSLEIVHGDLKGVCGGFLSRYALSCDNLIASRCRIMSLLTSRAVHDSMTSGSPTSLVSTVRRLPRPGSRDPCDGWPPNSSTLAKGNLVSPPANRTFSLLGWSFSR